MPDAELGVRRAALWATHRPFADVLSGELSIGGRAVRAGTTALSDPSGSTSALLRFTVPDQRVPCQVMIYSWPVVGEPVVLGGPFVMNKRIEIIQAHADSHAGKFGAVPRQPG